MKRQGYALLVMATAISILGLMPDLAAAQTSEEIVTEAVHLKRAGGKTEAIPLLKSLLQREPNNARAHYVLAWCFVDDERTEAARHFQQATQNGLQGIDRTEAVAALQRLGPDVPSEEADNASPMPQGTTAPTDTEDQVAEGSSQEGTRTVSSEEGKPLVGESLGVALAANTVLALFLILLLLAVWLVLRRLWRAFCDFTRGMPGWAWIALGLLVLFAIPTKSYHDSGGGEFRRYSQIEETISETIGIGRSDVPPEYALREEFEKQKKFFALHPGVELVRASREATQVSADLVSCYSVPPHQCYTKGPGGALLHGQNCPNNPYGTVVLGIDALNQELKLDGRLAVAALMAHELGHQVQFRDDIPNQLFRSGFNERMCLTLMEFEADALAGYYIQHSGAMQWANEREFQGCAEMFARTGDDLAPYMDYYGRSWYQPAGVHGTPDQRLKALYLGAAVADYERQELQGKRMSWDDLHYLIISKGGEVQSEPINVEFSWVMNQERRKQMDELQRISWGRYAPFGASQW